MLLMATSNQHRHPDRMRSIMKISWRNMVFKVAESTLFKTKYTYNEDHCCTGIVDKWVPVFIMDSVSLRVYSNRCMSLVSLIEEL